MKKVSLKKISDLNVKYSLEMSNFITNKIFIKPFCYSEPIYIYDVLSNSIKSFFDETLCMDISAINEVGNIAIFDRTNLSINIYLSSNFDLIDSISTENYDMTNLIYVENTVIAVSQESKIIFLDVESKKIKDILFYRGSKLFDLIINKLDQSNKLFEINDDKINIWDINKKIIDHQINFTGTNIDFSQDGKYIVSLEYSPYGGSEKIIILNSSDYSLFKELGEPSQFMIGCDVGRSIKFHPSNKFVVGSYECCLKIFDIESGSMLLRVQNSSYSPSISKDGKYICFNDGEGLKLFEFCFT